MSHRVQYPPPDLSPTPPTYVASEFGCLDNGRSYLIRILEVLVRFQRSERPAKRCRLAPNRVLVYQIAFIMSSAMSHAKQLARSLVNVVDANGSVPFDEASPADLSDSIVIASRALTSSANVGSL